jgi:diguanylate cyclase (GGDEF)-like protein/PAS domain S-box-containing protein
MSDMFDGFIIGLSVIFQFAAAFLAIRLIRVTGWRVSWTLISFAILLLSVQRSMSLFRLITAYPSFRPGLSSELVGLATSGLMLAGVWLLAPLFNAIRRSEEDLQRSEAKYRSLVESSEDSIYLIDRDYSYLFINKKHLARMGVSEDSYLGRSFGDYHSPQITAGFMGIVDAVFKTGESVQHEHRSERDNEYFLLTLSPVKDPEGTTIAVTVVSKKITELKRMQESLRSLSLTDDLTGLYNRRGFMTLADQHFKVARRLGNPVFMLYADLDDLKMINDTFGHRQGDIALIDVAAILRETYRESDIIARISGDEFVVMPVGDKEETANVIISRLDANLELHNSTMTRGFTLSVSVGIAKYDPANPSTVDELLAEGDRLMYQQKKTRKQSLSPES